MNSRKVIVYGAGGHAKVVADGIKTQRLSIIAFVDDSVESGKQSELWGIPILNPLNAPTESKGTRWIVAIGDNSSRRKVVSSLERWQCPFLNVIHPRATVSQRTRLGEGDMIFAGAIVNADTVIGDHVILNSGSIVEHDCVVGNYAHIAPGSKLGGGVRVGEGTLVGIGSTVLPRVTIGTWCTIGAGTIVIDDVPDGCVVVGVPGRVIKRAEECAQ